MTCVCGKGESNESCCLPVIRGERKAATAEELMRARYAAYALGEIDFVIDSHDPDRVGEVDRDNTEMWSKQSTWLGLEIVSTEQGGPEDDTGVVEFVARFKMKGVTVPHHERAEFRRHNGRWVFVDGRELNPPMTRSTARVGRNEPCVCGSGKKYKKCCGQAA
ncbi:MAG: YchJ family protein [Sorangiineae bacterium]|nr:YchJ family protein [Polyangiaceae bacterium]MEB2324214.1 YchJ family protein [Sorangiineae bacterium]